MCVISPQGIHALEGYKVTFISHFHDEHDSYAELNLKADKPGCKKAELIERFYVKYDSKYYLPTHEAILPKHRNKDVKVLASTVCVTNEANQNLAHSQKELLQWHFRMGHIGFQYFQWLICTERLKLQENPRQWSTVKVTSALPVSLERVVVDPIKENTTKKNPMKEQYLKKDNLLPVQIVSPYQYILRVPGRLYHKKGKSDPSDML